MKGWIYIISNKAMPGIIKIGYSTKDPKFRAETLNSTGLPYPYIVEYEMLIEEPLQMEQEIHKALSNKHEGKEWFRCSVEDAIATIKRIAESSIIYDKLLIQKYHATDFNQSPPPSWQAAPAQRGYYKCSNCGAINKVDWGVHCKHCRRPMCLNANFKL